MTLLLSAIWVLALIFSFISFGVVCWIWQHAYKSDLEEQALSFMLTIIAIVINLTVWGIYFATVYFCGNP